MPVTYQAPRHGVQLSDALAEAATTARDDRVMLSTLELRHPTIDPVRVVADYASLDATLEATAPVDAGATVTFAASGVRVSKPDESDSAATPEITIDIDNVSGAVAGMLKLGKDSLVPWEVTERVYASDDTSAPHIMPPTTLTLTSYSLDAQTAVFKASYGDPVNVSVPRITFKRKPYPGLVA